MSERLDYLKRQLKAAHEEWKAASKAGHFNRCNNIARKIDRLSGQIAAERCAGNPETCRLHNHK